MSPGITGVPGEDWRVRGAKPHPSKHVSPAVLNEVCAVLNQIIQLA